MEYDFEIVKVCWGLLLIFSRITRLILVKTGAKHPVMNGDYTK